MGLGGVDHLAREDEVERVALAHDARQALRSTVARCDAELDLGLPKPRGLARDPQVARHRELASPAQGVAVDRGHDRLAARLEASQHRL